MKQQGTDGHSCEMVFSRAFDSAGGFSGGAPPESLSLSQI